MLRRVFRCINAFRAWYDRMLFSVWLKLYGAEYSTLRIVGRPFLSVAKGGRLVIGEGFRMNSSPRGNAVGGSMKSVIRVEAGASLDIGKNVGVSSAVIVATCGITIGDNVKIGGGTYIIDSDFHSLDAAERTDRTADRCNARSAPVHIKENALIGARCMILKGCVIGRNAIIGAGSVVTGHVPDNEVWAGNPARCIRRV